MSTHIACPTQTDADSLALYDRARRVVMDATKRTGYPHRAVTKQLAGLAVAVVRLREARHTTVELRMLPEFLHAVIDELEGPLTPEMIETALRQESEADRREDAVQDLRLIAGDSVLRKELHAEVLDEQGTKSRLAARVLRWLVRNERSERIQQRARLGLPNGGVA